MAGFDTPIQGRDWQWAERHVTNKDIAKAVRGAQGWSPMSSAPRDGTEILIWYADYLGQKDLVVSAHWHCEEGREFEATWEHSHGFGDADMWRPLPEGPKPAQPAS